MTGKNKQWYELNKESEKEIASKLADAVEAALLRAIDRSGGMLPKGAYSVVKGAITKLDVLNAKHDTSDETG